MYFPLTLSDVSLLLGFTAIILLVTTGLLRQSSGSARLRIDRKRLKNVTIVFSLLFLVTVIMKIISISFPNLHLGF